MFFLKIACRTVGFYFSYILLLVIKRILAITAKANAACFIPRKKNAKVFLSNKKTTTKKMISYDSLSAETIKLFRFFSF